MASLRRFGPRYAAADAWADKRVTIRWAGGAGRARARRPTAHRNTPAGPAWPPSHRANRTALLSASTGRALATAEKPRRIAAADATSDVADNAIRSRPLRNTGLHTPSIRQLELEPPAVPIAPSVAIPALPTMPRRSIRTTPSLPFSLRPPAHHVQRTADAAD